MILPVPYPFRLGSVLYSSAQPLSYGPVDDSKVEPCNYQSAFYLNWLLDFLKVPLRT